MGDHVEDVMALLGGITKAVEAVKVIETEKVSTLRPAQHLIEAWEPHFVDGIASKNADGSIVTLDMIESAWEDGENIHLVGPSGCGKTTIARAILDRKNAETREENRKIWASNQKMLEADPSLKPEALAPYHELPFPMQHYSCHEDTRTEELVGKMMVTFDQDGNKMVHEVEGAVLGAWVHGKTLLLEEFDYAPPSTLGEVNLYFDGSSTEAKVYFGTPRTVYKNDAFRVIGTSNTKGAGEGATEFAGSQPMNAAFMNRFNYTVQVSWLPASEEAKLIRNKTGLHGKTVETMIKVAGKIREAYEEEQVEKPISTRKILAWAREINRAGKRIGKSAFDSMSDRDKWVKLAIPAAQPAIINALSDPASAEAVTDVLNLY